MLKNLKYKNVKDAYKISENGDIYSEYKQKFLKPCKDKDGYLKIGLRNNDGGITYARIATLVIYNFIGEPCKRDARPNSRSY